jgi:hypothetical protein
MVRSRRKTWESSVEASTELRENSVFDKGTKGSIWVEEPANVRRRKGKNIIS